MKHNQLVLSPISQTEGNPHLHFPTEDQVPRLFSFPTLFLDIPPGSLSSVSRPAHNNSGLCFGLNELVLPTLTKISRIPYNPKLLTLGVAFLFPGAQDVNGWALGVRLSASFWPFFYITRLYLKPWN